MHERFLRVLLRLALDHPRRVAVGVLVLTAMSAFVVPHLEVKAGHSKMVAADNPPFVRFNEFLERFGSPNALALMVEGGDEALRQATIDALAAELPSVEGAPFSEGNCDAADVANAPGCVRAVMGRIDLEPMASWGLLYLPVDQVEVAVERLEDETLGANVLLDTHGLASFFETLGAGIEAHAEDDPPEGEDLAKAEEGMGEIARVFDVFTRRVERGDDGRSLLDAMLGAADVDLSELDGVDRRGYLTSTDGSLKLAMVSMVSESDDPKHIVPFVEYVKARAAVVTAQINRSCTPTACPDGPVFIRATGLPAILADESRGIQQDIVLTSIIAFLGVFLVFAIAFRSKRLVLLAITPVVPALLWTMAIVQPFFGYLNIVTSAFVAIGIGLGVDFAVFILARYQEARRAGEDARTAAETAVMRAGPGLLTGGMTTALAFAALGLTDFKAFAEMGIMGGLCITLALLTSLTILPAVLGSERMSWFHAKIAKPSRSTFGARIPEFVVRRAALIAVLGIGIATSGGLLGRDIPWAFDYMDVLDPEFPSVQAWHELTRRTSHSTQVAALIADDIEEAKRFHDELATKSTVGRIESVVAYLPEEQPAKLAILKRLAPVVAGGDGDPEPLNRKAIVGAVQDLEDALADQRFEAERADAPQAAMLEAPIASLRRLRKAITALDDGAATARLGALQTDLLALRTRLLDAVRKSARGEELTSERFLADLPSTLRDRLANQGQFAVYVYPRAPLEEEEELKRFVSELYSVSEHATGFPINHWELYSQIRRGYHQAGLVTLLMVLFLLLLDFRSLPRALLGMMPLGLGLCGAWGGMWALDMRYNPATLIAFPLIVGIGVDAAVHILHRHYRQEGRADIVTVVRYTGRAVLLSGGTTMVGFGSLSLAGHVGIGHMGLVLLMGVGWSLFGAVVVLPAFLTLIEGRRTARERPDPDSTSTS